METRHPMQGIATRPSCLRDAPPSAGNIPDEGPRTLATQSLANATGCDGRTLRILPINTNASGQADGLSYRATKKTEPAPFLRIMS